MFFLNFGYLKPYFKVFLSKSKFFKFPKRLLKRSYFNFKTLKKPINTKFTDLSKFISNFLKHFLKRFSKILTFQHSLKIL